MKEEKGSKRHLETDGGVYVFEQVKKSGDMWDY